MERNLGRLINTSMLYLGMMYCFTIDPFIYLWDSSWKAYILSFI